MEYEAVSSGFSLGLGFWITVGVVLFVLVGSLAAHFISPLR